MGKRVHWYRPLPGLLALSMALVACRQPEAAQQVASSVARRPVTSVPPPAPHVALASALPAASSGPAPAPTVATHRTDALASQVSTRADPTPAVPNSPARRPLLSQPRGACAGGCQAPPRGCLLKGTITVDGSQLSRLPGQRGASWFCRLDQIRVARGGPAKALGSKP